MIKARSWFGRFCNWLFRIQERSYIAGLRCRDVATFVIVAVLLPSLAFSQSNIEVFGQNRIQDRKFDWKYFDTKHFRVYHYDKSGRELGRYVAEESEYDISVIEKKMGGQFPQRFNIILYNTYDEYRQCNVGLKEENPVMGNSRAGSVKLVDDKLVVYFTGQHADLRHQIRSGMATVVMQRMVYGDDLKKAVKNALLLNLPPWVTEGYIAYLVDGWDQKSNSEWKGMLDANPKKGFYEFAEENPELAGKAFWKFVHAKFGMNTVKSLLYSMQQKTSLNKAVKEPANLNMKVTKAYDSCINFYKNTYAEDAKFQDRVDSANGVTFIKVPRDNSELRNIRVSPAGTDLAYVSWKNGRYQICTQKTGGASPVTVLLEGGKRDLTEQTDPNYPMLCWSITGSKLAIMYRRKKEVYLRIYNNKRGRIETHKIPPNRFDRVLSMTFTQDDDKLVFSAIKKSQTDLYLFAIKGSKMTNITDDAWDDISPSFVSGGARTGIVFLSNRPQPDMKVPVGVNELPAGPLNVFFYNTVTENSELLQCSNVKVGHISQPVQYGAEGFAYLHDSNGVNNRYVVQFARTIDNKDSAYALPVTNYSTSIIRHQYNAVAGDMSDVVQQGNRFVVYFHDVEDLGDTIRTRRLHPTTLSSEHVDIAPPKSPIVAVKPEEVKKPAAEPAPRFPGRFANEEEEKRKPEIKGGNVFQSEFTDNEPPARKRTKRPTITEEDDEKIEEASAADSSVLTEITDSAYLKMKPSRYRKSFKPDYLSAKLDNSILFNQYQSIAANGGQFQNPTLGALTTISLNELMENQRITAGFQLPLQLNYSAYFLQYQNFTRRFDWGGFLYRKQTKEKENVGYTSGGVVIYQKEQLFRTMSDMAQLDFGYPLDRRKAIRLHTAVRGDRFVQKITDTLSLAIDFPKTNYYTSVSRVEFVFDNTISPATNIWKGTRYKVYGEYMSGLNNGNKYCYNAGVDLRNYEKLYKNMILATRLAYAHSEGNYMVQYLLGGVDNWMRGGTDAVTPYSGPNFGFQMLATSLRGYDKYARVGNSFGVLSNEVRLPIASTFFNRPAQSALLKNLQFVAFADAGCAWKGWLPNPDSLFQTTTFPQYASSGGLNNVLLEFRKDAGLAVGYGAGIRTALFGYFVRLDAAWNIEGDKKPMVYFALGTDF